jgi:hypothetical protein
MVTNEDCNVRARRQPRSEGVGPAAGMTWLVRAIMGQQESAHARVAAWVRGDAVNRTATAFRVCSTGVVRQVAACKSAVRDWTVLR